MKKAVVLIILFACFLPACRKKQDNPVSPLQATIVGNWRIDSVITYFHDSARLRNNGAKGYGNFSGYFFNFKPDSSWVELIADTLEGKGVSNGIYKITSDSTFTLLYATAVPATPVEPCKILVLTNTAFSFNKQLPAVFNGTYSGFIKYVFKLSK